MDYKKSKITAYRSRIFHLVEKSGIITPIYHADGVLIIKDGKIVESGDFMALQHKIPKQVIIEHFKNSLIIPGFIDAHLHYPQHKIIGSYGLTLLDWLNTYTFVEEQKFNDYDYCIQAAKLFFDEIIKNGTTTAMSFCTSHPNSVDAFFNEAQTRGMRMVGGKVMMDSNACAELCDDAISSFTDSKRLIDKWHNKDRLSYAITPRFAPTSSHEQLKKAGELLSQYKNDGVLLQTHLNENTDEIAWVKELFPQYASYFDVYDSCGLSGANSVFGHCIHNTSAELKRIAHTNSKIALCPRSNLFLGSGLFDLDTLDKHKICYSLATDVGGGDSFSMFLVMNEAYKIARLNNYNLSPSYAFYLATLAGAKVLNMEDKIGNFEKHKEADFLVLDLAATPLIKQRIEITTTIDEILFCLISLGDDRLVKKVFIMGNNVYNNCKQ